jgi:hypothetical protein
MAASNTRFTQNSLGQLKTPIDSDHGIYRDLRNVDANYPFDRSHRFAGIQPNSGFGDHSRLSCGVGDTQLGRRPGSRLARATPAELARIPRIRTEFRPGRPLAFELQRRDTQLGAGFCRDLQQAFCTDVGHHEASPLFMSCPASRSGRSRTGPARGPSSPHRRAAPVPTDAKISSRPQ